MPIINVEFHHPIINVEFHHPGRENQLWTECIDRRKFRIKKEVSVIAGKIQKEAKEVVRIHNAPKQVDIRLGDCLYETRIPKLCCEFSEANLAQHLQKTNTVTLAVHLCSQDKAERGIAMAMCLHPRLGRDSPLQMLDADTMRAIVRKVVARVLLE